MSPRNVSPILTATVLLGLTVAVAGPTMAAHGATRPAAGTVGQASYPLAHPTKAKATPAPCTSPGGCGAPVKPAPGAPVKPGKPG
jgi:hypothetical protein